MGYNCFKLQPLYKAQQNCFRPKLIFNFPRFSKDKIHIKCCFALPELTGMEIMMTAMYFRNAVI